MKSPIDLGLSDPAVDRADTSIMQSIWRRWWVVLLVTVVVTDAALLSVQLLPPSYTATTELVVQDPQTSQVFALPASGDPQRYVADQVQILRSRLVAERAAAILAESNLEPPIPTARDFSSSAGRLSVSSEEVSNVIEITFEDQRPEVAQSAANAVAEAYSDVRREEALRSSSSALDQLDNRIQELDTQIETIAGQIDPNLPPEIREALDERTLAVLDRILQLQAELLAAETPTEIESITTELDSLSGPASAIDSIVAAFQPANLQGLLDQQSALIARRGDLAATRDEIAVNAELAAGGVSFASPSSGPVQTGLGSKQVGALGVVVGLVLGAALAHWLALRDKRLTNHNEPGAILAAPLLADIPRFTHERLESQLPVRDQPRTATAEAFRFAASSVGIRRSSIGANCLTVISGTVADGKTTVTANLGLAHAAIATNGQRIAVVDADFGSQALTSLLLDESPLVGMTDVVVGEVELADALRPVDVTGGGSLFLLSRGQQKVNAPAFFSSDGVRDLIDELRTEFDLVLIDAPPILQIAYASTLADLADATIVIAGHGTDGSDLEEVQERLTILSKPCLGYVYTKAPLRDRMTQTGGSMTDVIGDAGLLVAPEKRKAR